MGVFSLRLIPMYAPLSIAVTRSSICHDYSDNNARHPTPTPVHTSAGQRAEHCSTTSTSVALLPSVSAGAPRAMLLYPNSETRRCGGSGDLPARFVWLAAVPVKDVDTDRLVMSLYDNS